MNITFMNYLLGEAAPVNPVDINPAQQNIKQQPQDKKMEMPGADKALQPPDEPPDLTTPPPQDDGSGGGGEAPPADQSAEGDPSADPNAAQDPNAQPQEDPNAAAAPAGAGVPTIQSPEAQIEQDEKDAFSDLKPEQMIIMKSELRDNYKTLYKLIIDTVDKINKISHTTYDDSMLDFIVKKFIGLKNQIRDSLIDSFSTRTYVSNKIELARFTYIFNQLTNMLTEIYKSRLKRQDAISKMNKSSKMKHDVEEFPLFSRGYEQQ